MSAEQTDKLSCDERARPPSWYFLLAARSTAARRPLPAGLFLHAQISGCSHVQGFCALCSVTKSPSFRKNILPGKLICEQANVACSNRRTRSCLLPRSRACTHPLQGPCVSGGHPTPTLLARRHILQAMHAAASSTARCGAASRTGQTCLKR